MEEGVHELTLYLNGKPWRRWHLCQEHFDYKELVGFSRYCEYLDKSVL
jgi:hypothetical protein